MDDEIYLIQNNKYRKTSKKNRRTNNHTRRLRGGVEWFTRYFCGLTGDCTESASAYTPGVNPGVTPGVTPETVLVTSQNEQPINELEASNHVTDKLIRASPLNAYNITVEYVELKRREKYYNPLPPLPTEEDAIPEMFSTQDSLIKLMELNNEEEFRLNDDFFKYLFFDSYLINNMGSNFYNIANKFAIYLQANSIEKNKNGILELFILLFTNPEIKDKSEILNSLDHFGHHLLLSGYVVTRGGHAINIYIIKNNSLTYTVYIINSGEGVENHGGWEGEIYPIVISCKDITKEIITDIIDMHLILTNINTVNLIYNWGVKYEYFKKYEFSSNYSQEEKETQKKEEEESFKQLPDFFKTNMKEDFISKSYEINANLFYKCIFSILKDKEINKDKYDVLQLSGSCTFFSTFYFVKHFVFDSNNDKFNIFINIIKEQEISKFINNFISAVNLKNTSNQNYNLINRFNIIFTLLKDQNRYIKNSKEVIDLIYNAFKNPIYSNILSLEYSYNQAVSDPNNNKVIHSFFLRCYKIFYNNPKSFTILNEMHEIIYKIYNGTSPCLDDMFFLKCIKYFSEELKTRKKLKINSINDITSNNDYSILIKLINTNHIYFKLIIFNLFIEQYDIKPGKTTYSPLKLHATSDRLYSDDIIIKIINYKNYQSYKEIDMTRTHIKEGGYSNVNYSPFGIFWLRYINQSFKNILKLRNILFGQDIFIFLLFDDKFNSNNDKETPVVITQEIVSSIEKFIDKEIIEGDEFRVVNRVYKNDYDYNRSISNRDTDPDRDIDYSKLLIHTINSINNNNIDNIIKNMPLIYYIKKEYIYMQYDLSKIPDFITVDNKLCNLNYTNYDIDSIENSIKLLDIDNFERQINKIPSNIIEIILYLLYLFNNDYILNLSTDIKEEYIKNLKRGDTQYSKNIMSLILEGDQYSVCEKYTGDERYTTSIYHNIFYINKIEDDCNFISQTIETPFMSKEEIRALPSMPGTHRLRSKPIIIDKYGLYIDVENKLLFLDRTIYTKDDKIIYFKKSKTEVHFNEQSKNGRVLYARNIDGIEYYLCDKNFNYVAKIGHYHNKESFDYNTIYIISKIRNTTEDLIYWRSENSIYIELENYNNSYFKYNSDTKKILFINELFEEYEIILNYNSIQGCWLFFSYNIFLLKKDTSYFLLVLFNDKFSIDNKEYWTYMNGRDNVQNKPKIAKTYYIIKLNYTFLSIESNDADAIIALYYSYYLSSNTIALYLLHPTYKNIIKLDFISETSLEIISYTDRYIMNVAIWPFLKLEKDYIDETRRMIFFESNIINSEQIKATYNLDEISKISKNFQTIQELSTRFTKINETISMNNSIYQETEKSKQLNKFIKEFRYLCKSVSEPVSEPVRYTNLTNTIKNSVSENIKEEENIKNIFTRLLNIDEKIITIPLIYLENYNYYYLNIINILYNDIIYKIKNLKETDKCSYILKIIEKLDTYIIYPLNENRNIEDIIFEIHNCLFIRKSQKKILNSIYANLDEQNRAMKERDPIIRERNNVLRVLRDARYHGLNDNIRASELRMKELKYPLTSASEIPAYEILMGQGKTTTITPLIILNQYYHNPVRGYNIVLPAHLVNQSYDIISNLSIIMFDIYIIKDKFNYDTYDKMTIISDTDIKKSVIKSIINSEGLEIVGHGIYQPNLFIFDEVDSLINPLKSDLNIPDSITSKHPDLLIISEICINIIYALTKGIDVNKIENSNIDIYEPINPMKPSTVKKLLYSANLNISSDKISIINIKINEILRMAYYMIFNQNYGFNYRNTPSFKDIRKEKDIFVAIPYNANHSPVSGSEFTDFELSVMLTTLCYFNKGIREIDIILLMKDISQKINVFNQLFEKNLLLRNTILDIYFKDISEFIPIDDIFILLDMFNKNDNYKIKCKQIVNNLNLSTKKYEFIKYYLQVCIFTTHEYNRFFDIKLNQHNITMIDIFNSQISNTKISFSGTVNFNIPANIIKEAIESPTNLPIPVEYYNGQITKIEPDTEVGTLIDASFYGLTTIKPEIINYDNQDLSKEETLIKNLILGIKNNKCNALIDTAGLIIKTSPIELISRIYTEINDLEKVLVYIDAENIRRIYHPNTPIKYNNTTLPNNIFIYYDHKNCVGADFKQPHIMHGLVTISNINNFTEISQGIFRLRNINIGHSIDFYCPYNIKTIDDLYSKLQKNNKLFITNTKPFSNLQCIKYIHRINKNCESESFKEKIFFDLVPQDDKYLSYSEFIKNMIESYNSTLEQFKFKENIYFLERNLLTNQEQIIQEQEQEQEIDLNIDTDIKQEVSHNNIVMVGTDFKQQLAPQKPEDYCNIVNTLYEHVEFIQLSVNKTKPNIDKIYTEITENFSKILRINVGPKDFYNIYLSPIVLYLLNTTDFQQYIFINNRNPNKILIITYMEYYLIITHLKYNPSICFNNISIYNLYGNKIFGNDTTIIFPNIIKLLLFRNSIDIIDQMHAIIEYYKYNQDNTTNNLQLFFFNNLLTNIKYDFSIEYLSKNNVTLDNITEIFQIGLIKENNIILNGINNKIKLTLIDQYSKRYPLPSGGGLKFIKKFTLKNNKRFFKSAKTLKKYKKNIRKYSKYKFTIHKKKKVSK